MKLVIIEGTDRTGKDTLIKNLSDILPNPLVRHWGYPQGDTNDEKTEYQKDSFFNEMEKWKLGNENSFDETLIWNRSHIGEYVYGTIYRDSQPHTWIPQLEKKYLSGDNVYLIFLHADPEFLVQRDDGKSYSDKLPDKLLEINKFHEAIDNSKINNKIKIKVNDGNQYIDQTHILNQIRTSFGF